MSEKKRNKTAPREKGKERGMAIIKPPAGMYVYDIVEKAKRAKRSNWYIHAYQGSGWVFIFLIICKA